MKYIPILFASFLYCLVCNAADVELVWTPPPLLNQGTGYLLQHAGSDGKFTNLTGVSLSATNVVVKGLAQGQHSFIFFSTNATDISNPGNTVSTNLSWKPEPPTDAKVKSVTVTVLLK